MCDSLCMLRPDGGGSIFAKNSDRPFQELQRLVSYPARKAVSGEEIRTQYLSIRDLGAFPTVLSQPDWLFGAEHGVNAHHVAIGNEKVNGTADPYAAEPALIGMDLVRLGLERARTATEAVDVITDLIETYGQGGMADKVHNEPYWSSFLIVDPGSSWILETSGQSWAAKPVDRSAAISNRISITTDWSKASSDVVDGSDFDTWRDPDTPTGHADKRLQASVAFVNDLGGRGGQTPWGAQTAAHLRDHGRGPWGSPTDPDHAKDESISELPQALEADGTGVTVCMHVRGYVSTTASLLCELPDDPSAPVLVRAALGSPCASVYVPFPVAPPGYDGPDLLPRVLGDLEVAKRFAALRGKVEQTVGALGAVRATLGPVEAELWSRATGLGDDLAKWAEFRDLASEKVLAGLDTVEGLAMASSI